MKLKNKWQIIPCLFLLTGMASAAPNYKLLMSKNDDLCKIVLNYYNNQQSIKISQIQWQEWQSVEPWNDADYCMTVKQARFDIDNDGKDELVIKYTGCINEVPGDSLEIFPSDSDVLSKLKYGIGADGLAPLFLTPNVIEGTYRLTELPKPLEKKYVAQARKVFYPAFTKEEVRKMDLRPITSIFLRIDSFKWQNENYIVMDDSRGEFTVVGKYQQLKQMQDICYFQK